MFSGIIYRVSLGAGVVNTLGAPQFRGGELLRQGDLRPVPGLSKVGGGE